MSYQQFAMNREPPAMSYQQSAMSYQL